MAGQTVREFITKLGYKIDDTKLRQYNSQLNKLKQNAKSTATAIRTAFKSADVSFKNYNKKLVQMRSATRKNFQMMNKTFRKNFQSLQKTAILYAARIKRAVQGAFTGIRMPRLGGGRTGRGGVGGNLGFLSDSLGTIGGIFAISKIKDMADETQSLEARIAQLPQTTGKAADSFEAVVNAAIAARQPFEEFGSLYTRIGHVSQDIIPTQEKLLEVVSTISKSFIVGGTKAREQAAAMMQLSQAFNKGKLDGDEFRTVIEAMPGQITRALAKKMGYDSMALFETARENGELTIEKLVKGFKELNTYVNNQFKQMPMTISQGLTIVGNRFALFLAKLNRESGVVTEIADLIVKGFDAIGQGWERVVKFFGGERQVWRTAKLLFGTWLAPKVLRGVGAALAFVGKKAFWVATGLIALVAAGDDFYVWLTGGKSVFGDYFGNIDEFAKKHKYIMLVVKGLRNLVVNAWNDMGLAFEAFKNKLFGGETEKGLKGWIQGSMKSLDEGLKSMFGTSPAARKLFMSPAFQAPNEYQKMTASTKNEFHIMVSTHEQASGKEIGRQIRTEVQKIKLPGVADMMMGGHVR